jgi:hypothetical protein
MRNSRCLGSKESTPEAVEEGGSEDSVINAGETNDKYKRTLAANIARNLEICRQLMPDNLKVKEKNTMKRKKKEKEPQESTRPG